MREKVACCAVIFILLAAIWEANTESKVRYSEYQVWKVRMTDSNSSRVVDRLLKEQKIVTWAMTETAVDILIPPTSLEYVRRRFNVSKVHYDVNIVDLQRAIDNEKTVDPGNSTGFSSWLSFGSHSMSWKSYHRLSTIYGFINYLARKYPKICTQTRIGRTFENRPIMMLKVSNGKYRNRAVWIEGGIHGREWISPAAVTYFLDYLVPLFDDANETSYMQEIDWYVVPVLNPDGYEYSHTIDRLWRKNRARFGDTDCCGVDLNRNFGFNWNLATGATAKDPCSRTYRGPAPFSEHESAAVARFFLNNTNIKWTGYIAFHSYGQQILYPWGASFTDMKDTKDVEKVAHKTVKKICEDGGAKYSVGGLGKLMYEATGTSTDWAKGTASVKYSYIIELRDEGQFAFILPSSLIIPTANEALSAIKVIAEAAAYT